MTKNLPAVYDENLARLSIGKIVERIPPAECTDLVVFIDRLVEIRDSNHGAFKKMKATIAETLNFKVLWPVLKVVADQLKSRVWDKTSTNGRLGILGAAVGIMFFGGQAAGIAAMGTAISVPLWIVFGAGAMYANYLREALVKKIVESTAPTIDL